MSPALSQTLSRRERNRVNRRSLRLETLEIRLPLSASSHEPQNVTVSNISESSFDLSWEAPAKGADSYLVAHLEGSVPGEQCSSGTVESTTALSHSLTSLASSTIYYTRVCAVEKNRVSTGITTEVTTNSSGNAPSVMPNFWEYPHRMAVSDNGHKMLVWVNYVDSERHVFYARYDGVDWSDTGDLSPSGRNAESGVWDRDYGNFDVAAGDDGSFVVAWLDENNSGVEARLNVNQFMAGAGWDHAPGTTPTNFGLNDGQHIDGLQGINADMAPTGDAAVAVVNGEHTSDLGLWVYYRASNEAAWSQIASDGALTDAPDGEEDTSHYGAPGMEMDAVGNVLVAFATDSSLVTGSGMDIHYAVYDKSAANWGPGRQTFTTGWANVDTVRVTVDKTRDLTDSSASNNRGLAGIAWTAADSVFGAVYYKGGAGDGGDVDDDFIAWLNAGDGNASELNGFDIADGQGHILVSWTNTVSNNQELMHFWYEDTDNDGLFDSAEELLEADGCQCAGWKTAAVTVNDAGILNSPYEEGDANASSLKNRNPARLSGAGTDGLVVWDTAAQDAVHVRRIIGYDSGTQSVILEGNASTEIANPQHHTLESSTSWTYSDWSVSAAVNYKTGEGATLHHSETDGRLHVTSFAAGPPNEAPTANAGAAQSGLEDVSIIFDASGSTDPDGDALTYVWDFGDGQTAQTMGTTISHTYLYGGTFDVTLTVHDGQGNQASDTTSATVTETNDVPEASASGPYQGIVDTAVTFDASLSSDFDNLDATLVNDQPLTYTWDLGDGTTVTTSTTTLDHTYSAGGTYNVTLTVSDGVDTDSETTSATIVTGSVNDMYVWDIGFETRQRGARTDFRIMVNVNRDSNADGLAGDSDAVADGVQVTIELRDSGGVLVNTFTGNTNSDGIVRFDWIKGLTTGDYTAEVLDLAHATLKWNHLLDLGFDDEDSDGDGLPDDTFTLP